MVAGRPLASDSAELSGWRCRAGGRLRHDWQRRSASRLDEGQRVSPQITSVRARHLVGRDREISEVAKSVASEPLTTMTGPGGVGRTTLALAVATEASARFPDGVFVVWLASLRSADLVAGEVAAQVGMQRSGGQSSQDALAQWLADRDDLLVLDNCEHVVSAVAGLVEDLARWLTPSRSRRRHWHGSARQMLGRDR